MGAPRGTPRSERPLRCCRAAFGCGAETIAGDGAAQRQIGAAMRALAVPGGPAVLRVGLSGPRPHGVYWGSLGQGAAGGLTLRVPSVPTRGAALGTRHPEDGAAQRRALPAPTAPRATRVGNGCRSHRRPREPTPGVLAGIGAAGPHRPRGAALFEQSEGAANGTARSARGFHVR